MKRRLYNLLALGCGAIVTVLLFELLFRQLPVPMGLYRTEDFRHWPLHSFEPHRKYKFSMTWEMRHGTQGVTNNYGHLAPFDFVPNSRPVVVIGDSYIESMMNPYPHTLQAQLGQLLGRPYGVYGIGVSGLSLADYLGLAKLAGREFSPVAAVVLVSDGDIKESLLAEIGHYYFRENGQQLTLDYSPLYGDTLAKKVRRLIGDSALYRYVQGNLRLRLDSLFETREAHPTTTQAPRASKRPQPRVTSGERLAIDGFLARFPDALGVEPACVVLLFDTDRYAIYGDSPSPSKDSPQAIAMLKERALARGYRVVDLESRFRASYAIDHRRFDYWPIDRHWNIYGHGIAARAALDSLHTVGPQECTALTRSVPTNASVNLPVSRH